MTKHEIQKTIEFMEEHKGNLSNLQNYSGFELFQKWRDLNFDTIGKIIKNKDVQRGEALLNLSELMGKEFEIFIETGFFHEAYKHNLTLFVEIFISNFEEPEKLKTLSDIIDTYIKPKTEKTQGFNNTFYKGLSGLLAYFLAQQTECSENLAVFISKQVFEYGSEQTVYEHFTKIKHYVASGKSIPLSAKLTLFYVLYYMSVDWNSLDARAKQGRSINDLKNGLKCLQIIREQFVMDELYNAQQALKTDPSHFIGEIEPDFMENILHFENRSIKIDDEFTCALLWVSFFGNKIHAALLPKEK